MAYADDWYGMEVKDQMLCRDILASIPGVDDYEEVDGYIYKYAQDAEGLLILRNPTAGSISPQVVHSTPRQLGWFMDAYAGECNVVTADTPTSSIFGLLSVDNEHNVDYVGPSYRMIAYRGPDSSPYDTASRRNILGPAAVNVNRAQAFAQIWTMRRASSILNVGSANFDVDISVYDGFVNVAADGESADPIVNHTTFQPYTFERYNGVSVGANPVSQNIYTGGPYLFSFHRIFWAILQKMPFVINPFDATPSNVGHIGCFDPFAFAYMFNVAGFMSASYHEEVYNRLVQRMNQGYGYTKDPLISASPLFKDAGRYTQVG